MGGSERGVGGCPLRGYLAVSQPKVCHTAKYAATPKAGVPPATPPFVRSHWLAVWAWSLTTPGGAVARGRGAFMERSLKSYVLE